jgi:hypothetical protein
MRSKVHKAKRTSPSTSWYTYDQDRRVCTKFVDGEYPSLSACINANPDGLYVNCDMTNNLAACVTTNDGYGQFKTQGDCYNACKPVGYYDYSGATRTCVPNGRTYPSLESCMVANADNLYVQCNQTETDAECVTVNNGSGDYFTHAACSADCFPLGYYDYDASNRACVSRGRTYKSRDECINANKDKLAASCIGGSCQLVPDGLSAGAQFHSMANCQANCPLWAPRENLMTGQVWCEQAQQDGQWTSKQACEYEAVGGYQCRTMNIDPYFGYENVCVYVSGGKGTGCKWPDLASCEEYGCDVGPPPNAGPCDGGFSPPFPVV